MTLWVPLASKTEAQNRYEICKVCDEFSHSLKICKHCFCFAKAKVRLSYTSCPVGKWGPVDEDKSVKPYDVEKEIK